MKKKRFKRGVICYSVDPEILEEYVTYELDDSIERLEEKIDREIMIEKVYHIIEDALSIRERQVLCLVYGIMGEERHSVKDVAKILRISVSGVYKTLDRAINKIRRLLDEERY